MDMRKQLRRDAPVPRQAYKLRKCRIEWNTNRSWPDSSTRTAAMSLNWQDGRNWSDFPPATLLNSPTAADDLEFTTRGGTVLVPNGGMRKFRDRQGPDEPGVVGCRRHDSHKQRTECHGRHVKRRCGSSVADHRCRRWPRRPLR